MTSTANAKLHDLFSVLSQNLAIVETQLTAFLGDIGKVLSIKKLYNN